MKEASRQFISLRTKLAAANAAIVLVSAFLLVFILSGEMGGLLDAGESRRSETTARLLANALAPSLEFEDQAAARQLLAAFATTDGAVDAEIYNEDGGLFVSLRADATRSANVAFQNHLRRETRGNELSTYTPIQARGGSKGTLVVQTSLAAVDAGKRTVRGRVMVVTALSVLFALALGLWLGRRLVAPISELTALTKTMVESKQLSLDISVRSNDEVGLLSDTFQEIVSQQRDILAQVAHLARQLHGATTSLAGVSQAVRGVASTIEARVDDGVGAVGGLRHAMGAMSHEAGSLHDSSQLASSSAEDLAEINTRLRTSVGKMASSVGAAGQASDTMARLVHQTMVGVSSLDTFIGDTSSSMGQMSVSIERVNGLSSETMNLAERVREQAEGARSAISRSRIGVEDIASTTQQVSEAVARLNTRIDEIGVIVRVIEEVAQRTNLLSLNAAIVAARAGEQGHGFSVIADEVQQLAEKTRENTSQIHSLVGAVGAESQVVSSLMRRGLMSVSQGTELALEAEAAINAILESSAQSAVMARTIAEATGAQALSSRNVGRATKQLVETSQRLSETQRDQEHGATLLRECSEQMKLATREVEVAEREQGVASTVIAESMAAIRVAVDRVRTAHEQQTQQTDLVIVAVTAMSEETKSERRALAELDATVQSMVGSAQALDANLAKFTR